MDKTAEVAQLLLIQQFLQRDRTCLVRLAGEPDLPALFFARTQADPGFISAVSTVLDGYGHRSTSPDATAWGRFAESAHGSSWEAVWRALLLVRLSQGGPLLSLQGGKKELFAPLTSRLRQLPRREAPWSEGHTSLVAELGGDLETSLLAKDLADLFDQAIGRKGRTLWLVFSDLGDDLLETRQQSQAAITGLFEMIQALDARRLSAIRPLVFLQESVWERLIFQNKSHFNGRDLRLFEH